MPWLAILSKLKISLHFTTSLPLGGSIAIKPDLAFEVRLAITYVGPDESIKLAGKPSTGNYLQFKVPDTSTLAYEYLHHRSASRRQS